MWAACSVRGQRGSCASHEPSQAMCICALPVSRIQHWDTCPALACMHLCHLCSRALQVLGCSTKAIAAHVAAAAAGATERQAHR